MKKVSLILATMLCLAVSLNAQSEEHTIVTIKKSSIGVGIGIPYGIVGTNFDINVAPNVNFSMGIGTTIFAGMGYNFGAKVFLVSPESNFRPRLSAYYGINSMIVPETGFGLSDDGKSYSGLSVGFGAQWMWGSSKSNGLDFDFVYIASSNWDLKEWRKSGYVVDEPGKLKISVGYRHGI